MAERFANRKDIRFLLEEVFDVNSLTQYDYFKDHSADTFNMVIDTVMKMGSEMMYPVFQEMDKNPPRYEDLQAKVHPAVRVFLDECGQGGWLNADWDYTDGGQQLPNMIKFLCWFVFSASNYALGAYAQLTAGAANLIREFASPEIKEKYLEKLYTGKWQGTMALTEPDIGSSLGDLMTSAQATDQGYYLIKGKKMFISGADTDAVENTVNMMLARIQGAPAGAKGISLFVVPKYRVNEEGKLEYNDVNCDGIEHKLGYRGCPICQLTMGENNDCHGYLVGKPGRGLGYMFQMMNEERINVGIGAVAKATAAYYAALEYCSQRKQGRRLSEKDQSLPMVPLIEHPDIKRMLLMQKSIAEGGLSLALQVSKYLDLIKVLPEEEREKYSLLVELLVPVVKTYPAEAGILATSAAIQCLGGYGYCQDFPVEQYFRDIRIDPIHEGTTGIQGQDILGRKISLGNGKAMQYFVAEMLDTIEGAYKFANLQGMADQLLQSINELRVVTTHLLDLSAQGKVEEFLADGVLYLELFSLITIAWQWLLQAITSSTRLQEGSSALLENDRLFYEGKIYTCRYFFSYELNKIYGLAKRLTSNEPVTVEMEAKFLQV
ncbi:MAG: acyl-CoA dehydrogenase [Firmicutes bacterium]|nr:acyl-CoA dehydrogenase [Bacillota bacterium]